MNRAQYVFVLLVIAAFVISMGILWRDNVASEDSDQATTYAGVVFLVCVVCGPGVLAKWVYASLVPVEELAKNRRRLKREIDRATRERDTARTEIRVIQTLHAWWKQEAERMRAIYLLHYREARDRKNPYKE